VCVHFRAAPCYCHVYSGAGGWLSLSGRVARSDRVQVNHKHSENERFFFLYAATDTDGDQHSDRDGRTMRAKHVHVVIDPIFIKYIIIKEVLWNEKTSSKC
jgi:hypothetical protein